jgi:hypothetical protein
MNELTLIENQKKANQKEEISLNWQDFPSIQRLLDVISFILIQEYFAIAKQNPEVFKAGGAR